MARTSSVERAVDTLRSFGLTEYEARCLVGLSRVADATASEVAELCDVPRSRVYDTADRLAERGLVEVQDGNPRRYRALPIEIITEKFDREFHDRLDRLESTLGSLATAPRNQDGDHGIWTVSGRGAVIERAQRLIDEADEELFLMITTEDLLDAGCLEHLAAASDRGVAVLVATESDAVKDRLTTHLPGVTTVGSPVDWMGLPSEGSLVGRIVMADRAAVLVATVGETDPDTDETVTGIWSRGEDSGMVSVLRELIGFRIDRLDAE